MFHFGRLILFSLISTFGTASITANAIGNTMGNFHVFAGQAICMGDHRGEPMRRRGCL